jgi:hypothetical protein
MFINTFLEIFAVQDIMWKTMVYRHATDGSTMLRREDAIYMMKNKGENTDTLIFTTEFFPTAKLVTRKLHIIAFYIYYLSYVNIAFPCVITSCTITP